MLLIGGVALSAAGVVIVQERYLPPRLSADASASLRSGFEHADARAGRFTAQGGVLAYNIVLTRMALTLAYAHGHASRRVAEPGRVAPSAKGRVWAVAFAFVAQYVRADGRPCIERST